MLRFGIRARPRKMASLEGLGSGPEGRLKRLRKIVTGLVRHERLEMPHGTADEARGYAERLIQLAMKHGDQHPPTMEMADYWLLEKDLIHKLFKVLVPRFQNSPHSFTSMWNLPTKYPGPGGAMAILEFKGNPWPPVQAKQRDTRFLLSNVLLDAAKQDYNKQKKMEQSLETRQSHDQGETTAAEHHAEQEVTSQDGSVAFVGQSGQSTVDCETQDIWDVTSQSKNTDLKPA
ncbi:large ribosomal subunit protein bL17m-like [Haliotis cracherodii]|uniref:large ribosomal subunit protein bL17m-like n=1 Tax=Haliotis cracherodii TaxID=6455 RepID=UPI0039EC44D3